MKYLIFLVAILGLVALIIFGLDNYNQSAASKAYARGQARAMILEAQGQARLDAAQANAVNMSAALPYVIIGVVAVFGGVILILAVVILNQQQQHIERIETKYVMMLPAGISRRETYQLLSGNAESIRIISANYKEN